MCRPRAVMGLAKVVKGSPRLCSAKECFHVLVGQVESGRTVTLGILISISVC